MDHVITQSQIMNIFLSTSEIPTDDSAVLEVACSDHLKEIAVAMILDRIGAAEVGDLTDNQCRAALAEMQGLRKLITLPREISDSQTKPPTPQSHV